MTVWWSSTTWRSSARSPGRSAVLHLGRLFAQGTIEEITANEAVQEIYLGKGHHHGH